MGLPNPKLSLQTVLPPKVCLVTNDIMQSKQDQMDCGRGGPEG